MEMGAGHVGRMNGDGWARRAYESAVDVEERRGIAWGSCDEVRKK